MVSPINLFILYSIIKKLVTPFNKTKAYKLGIIDAEGNILKRRSKLTTVDERAAYTLFDTFVFNMKKMLAKVPGGSSKFASFLAAGFLLKESEEQEHGYITSGSMRRWIDEESSKFLIEETPANSTGAGIALTDNPLKYNPVRRSTFAGKTVFDVDSDTFAKNLNGRKKWARHKKFIGDTRISKAIKKYSKEFPKNAIILRDINSKSMIFWKQ